MSVLAVLLLGAVSLLGVVGFRRKGERQYLIPALAGVGVIALNLRTLPSLGMRSLWFELLLALLVGVLLADVQGLPRPLAARLRFGWRCREWEFDRQLQRSRAQLDRSLLGQGVSDDWEAYRRWQASVHRKAPRLVKRLRALKAPSQGWASVRDDYADLYEQIVGRIERDEAPDDHQTLARSAALIEKTNRLRAEYRSKVPPNMRRTP